MKWYDYKTVQKGRQLANEEAVKKRLLQIKANKKSAYYKPLKEGRLAVLVSKNKRYGGKGLQYDLVVLEEISPKGSAECGECGESYFDLDDDYLCTQCRSLL